jgi:CHAT domain-containing protein
MIRRHLLILLIMLLPASPSPRAGESEMTRLMMEGARLLEVSDYAGSLERFEKSLALALRTGDRVTEGQVLLLMARRSLELRSFDLALDEAARAIDTFKSINDPGAELWGEVVRIAALDQKKQRIKAWALMEKIEARSRAGCAVDCLIDFYLVRGSMLLNRENEDLALKNLEEACRLARQEGDRARTVQALRDLAQLHSSAKRFEKAREYCAAAMESALESGSLFLQGFILETEGDIKSEEARHAEARSQLLGALAVYRQCANPGKVGQMYLRIASTYSGESAWESFCLYCRKAIEAYTESKDTWGRITACDTLFNILFITHKKEDQALLLREYQALTGAGVPAEYQARAHYQQGKLLRHFMMDFPGSFAAVEKAEALYGALGEKRDVLRCIMEKGGHLLQRGRLTEALVQFDRAAALRDTFGETVRQDDVEFFNSCSPGQIRRQKGVTNVLMSRYDEARASYTEALVRDESRERTRDRVMDRHGLIVVSLAVYDYRGASEEVRLAFDEIGTLKKPLERAVLYNLIMMALIPSGRSAGLNIYETRAEGGDSLDRMVLEGIYRDPETVRKIRQAYQDWIRYEEERKDWTGLAIAWLFQGYFLATGRMDPEAGDSYARALEMAKKSGVAMWEALTYTFMTIWHAESGRLDQAIAAQQEALRVNEQAGIRDGTVNALSMLGALRRKAGRYREALDSLNRAISLSGDLAMPRYTSQLRAGRGVVLYLMKEYGQSLDAFMEVLPALDKVSDRSRAAMSLAFIARNLRNLGREGEAIEYYRKAFVAFEKLDSIFELRDTALELGDLLEKTQRPKEALECYEKAVALFTGFRENLPIGKGLEGLSEQKATVDLFERVVALLMKAGRYDDALRYIEMSRSRELIEALDVENIRTSDEKLQDLLRKVQELRRKIAILKRDVEGADNEKRRERLTGVLASTRQEFFATLNELRSRNPDFEQVLTVKGSDLAEIQKTLPAGHLILEYYPSKDSLYIFAVTSKTFSIHTVAVSRERLYGLLRLTRSCITERTREEELKTSSALLYSFLIDPAAGELAKCPNLHIIPGGLLWYLPFEILRKEGSPYLVEEKTVSYLTSSDVLRLVQRRKGAPQSSPHLVAFANPDAGLHETTGEVRVLGSYFPGGKIFIGSEATKERFLQEAPSAAILHIATHSALDRENINRSFIQFAGPEGKLFLGEVYGLDLGGTDLVTLSSCESALGEERPGSELASLASAFTTAGASSVIASLWRVEDASTAALFKAFYRNIRDGVPKAEALRRAKIDLLRADSTAAPFSWGGFILMGGSD